MVKLKDYKLYCEMLGKLTGSSKMIMVVHEDHLKKRLRDEPGMILVAVYPSIQGTGTEDNTGVLQTMLVFLLEYAGKQDMTPENEIDSYDRMLAAVEVIREQILKDAGNGLEMLRGLERESIVIEPEWNVAGSYNGWSIGFSVKKY